MKNIDWLTARPLAHRGLHDGNKKVWENTLHAFELAVAANFAIECDVHLTQDNQVIVFHDSDLKRLVGVEGSVHAHTADQITALHIGGTSQQVPLLSDMLNLVAGRVPLVIELKGVVGDDDGLLQALAYSLLGYHGHVAVMSFDHHLIREVKKYLPNIPCGLTAEGNRDIDMEAHFSMLAYDLDFVSYNVHHLDNRFLHFVRQKLGLPVITWTVRTADELALTKAGADQATFELMNPDLLGA